MRSYYVWCAGTRHFFVFVGMVGLAACSTPHSAEELKSEARFKRSFQSDQPYETVVRPHLHHGGALH